MGEPRRQAARDILAFMGWDERYKAPTQEERRSMYMGDPYKESEEVAHLNYQTPGLPENQKWKAIRTLGDGVIITCDVTYKGARFGGSQMMSNTMPQMCDSIAEREKMVGFSIKHIIHSIIEEMEK